jgi:hypothetical protein
MNRKSLVFSVGYAGRGGGCSLRPVPWVIAILTNRDTAKYLSGVSHRLERDQLVKTDPSLVMPGSPVALGPAPSP